MKNEEMMRHGTVRELFVKLCLPTMLIMIVMVVYNMADTYFIGRTGDPAKVAAISLAGPLYGLIQGMGTLLGTGGCTALAIALGRGERGQVRSISAFCFYGTLIISAIFVAAGAMFTPQLAVLLGASGDVLPYTEEYLRVLCLGTPLMLYPAVAANVVRSDGSMKEAVVANMGGTLTNIALDPIFIQVLGMGVRGAALATVAGNVLSTAILLRFMLKRRDEYSFSPRDINFSYKGSWQVITLGLPMTISTLLSSFASVFANNLMATYGSTAIAAQNVASKATMLIAMIEMGLCMGIQPAISYNYGAGDIKRMGDIVKKTALVALGSALILTLGFWMGRGQFISAFIDDAQVLDYGIMMISASLIVAPLIGPYQVCTGFLQATGKVTFAIMLSALRQGALYIPMLYVFNALGGLNGLVYAGPATDVLALGIALTLCLSWLRAVKKQGSSALTP